MRKKISIAIIMIAFLVQLAVAWAGEEPPRPGFLGTFIGEKIFYFQVGITAGISVKKGPNSKWESCNPNKPEELKPRWQLKFDLMCENGRKSGDQMKNTLAVSDKPEAGSPGMKIIYQWEGMFGTVIYTIPDNYRGYQYFRSYSDSGTKDQNNFDGCAFYVGDPDEAQLSSEQQPNLPTGPTGTLEINFMEKSPLRFSKFTIPQITLYIDGKEIYRKEDIKGFWRFTAVPVGNISIVYKDNNKWVFQKGSNKRVEKDQTTSLVLIRKGGEVK